MVYSRWSSGYFHSCSFDMCNNLVGYEFSCPTVLFFQKACRTVPFRGELLYSLMSVALGTELSQLANSSLPSLPALQFTRLWSSWIWSAIWWLFRGSKARSLCSCLSSGWDQFLTLGKSNIQDICCFWPSSSTSFGKFGSCLKFHFGLNILNTWTHFTMDLKGPWIDASRCSRCHRFSRHKGALQKMSILVSALLARQVICRSPRASLSSGLRTEKILDFAKPAIHSMHWGTRL